MINDWKGFPFITIWVAAHCTSHAKMVTRLQRPFINLSATSSLMFYGIALIHY